MTENFLYAHKEAEIVALAAAEPTANQYGYIKDDQIFILGTERQVLDDTNLDCDAVLIIRNWRTPYTQLEMEVQINHNKPLVIYRKSETNPSYDEIGDHRLQDPLVGRPYRHGVYDCGSAIRSWFFQRAELTLRDMPRDYMWWDAAYVGTTENLYSKFIDRDDWDEVECETLEDLRKGDVFTFAPAIRLRPHQKGVEHHAGVYVGNSVVFHHPLGHTSRFDAAAPWLRRMGKVRWYRRKDIDTLVFGEPRRD